MKGASAGLQTILAGNVQEGARLFAFYFDAPLLVTDAGWDILYTDATGTGWYRSATTAVRRGRSTIRLSVDPDDVEVTLGLGSLANGETLRMAAKRGAFDGKRCRILRLFSTTAPGDLTPGAIVDVDGPCQVSDVTSTELRILVKSRTFFLKKPSPPRVIAPACQWRLYGAGCGVDPASHTETRTLTGASTTTSLVCSSAPTLINVGGLAYFTSGSNIGAVRTVKGILGATVTVSVPFPFTPTDMVTLRRGCTRTRSMCDGTFDNLAHFGGTPDVPDTAPILKV